MCLLSCSFWGQMPIKGINWPAEFRQVRENFDKELARNVRSVLRKIGQQDEGQDIAEYAVMLAVILIVVVGTLRLIGSNANTVFSNVASSVQ